MRFKTVLMLIVLLFSMIFSVGMVSATLNVRSITGSSGINYRMANDTVVINVSSTSNVSVNGVLCHNVGLTNYICSVTDTVNQPQAVYQLTNDDGDIENKILSVDNNIGSISYTIQNAKGNATLDYIIQDLGFNNNNACSGITSIIVYDGSTKLNIVDIAGTPGTCTYSGSLSLSISNSGKKSISLEVRDNAGNVEKSPPQNISLDLSSPVIVNGLQVKYSGSDDDLLVIGGSASILVDIFFNIREDNLASINLDLSGATINPALQYIYKDVDVPISNCNLNTTNTGTVYTCNVKGVQLKLPGDVLSVNVVAKDIYGGTGSAVLTKPFKIDNIEPVVSITTDKCDSLGRCFIKSGMNDIILTTNKKNFDKKYLFFYIPGSTFTVNRVQNCSDIKCTATVSLTCDSGTPVEVSITSFSGLESQDDAGNIVAPYSTYLYCDNEAPSITNINVTGESSDILKDLLVSGSTVTITADVLEVESEELVATVSLDKLKNATEKGTCTKFGNYDYNCVWVVSNINDKYYEANILINVSDTIGNYVEKNKKFTVFGFKSDNETPDFLEISLGNIYPEKINRIVLDMATWNNIPYYVYATYKLNVKNGVEGVSVLHQYVDLNKCVYISPKGSVSANVVFSEIIINNPYSKIEDIGRVDLKFLDNTDVSLLQDDVFTVSCNISATVKKGTEIYRKTQELQLDMSFNLMNTKLCAVGEECTPGSVLGKKIEKAENNFWVKTELMGTINNLIPKLQKFCSLRGYVNQASSASQLLSMVMNGVSISTGEVEIGNIPVNIFLQLWNLDACLSGPSSGSRSSNNMALFGNRNIGLDDPNTVGNLAQTALDVSANPAAKADMRSKCSQIVGKACDILSCSVTDKATNLTQSVFEDYKGSHKVAGIGDTGDPKTPNALPDLFGGKASGTSFGKESVEMLTDNINVPDVKNSIVMAAATQCWPAVYYNLNKWRQTECSYLYCLKMAAYTGTDVSACDMAKRAQTCSMIVGEVFELPGANIVKNLAENAADYATNFLPLAGASILKKIACPSYTQENVFTNAKVELPTTVIQQTWQIYGCQLPLQIARFVDINTRSAQRGQFIYPETPDMCQYAKCVGEADCQYEPDFWETLNKVQLSGRNGSINKIDNTKQLAQAASNQKLKDLRSLSLLDTQITVTDNLIQKQLKNTPNSDLTALKVQRENLNKQRIGILTTLQKDGVANDYMLTNDDILAKIKTDPLQYLGNNAASYNNIIAREKAILEANKDINIQLVTTTLSDGSTISQYALLDNEAGTLPDIAKAQKALNDLYSLKSQEEDILNKAVPSYNNKVISNNAVQIKECLLKGITNCIIKGADTKVLSDELANQLKIKLDEKDPKYAAQTLAQKKNTNIVQAEYLQKLKQYDDILRNGVDFEAKDPASYEAAVTGYVQVASALGLCGGTNQPSCNKDELVNFYASGTNTDAKTKYLQEIDNRLKAAQSNVVVLDKTIRKYETSEKMGNGLYIALQALNAKKMINFMFTGYWTERMFGVDVSDYLDFNKYKESLCNPANPINVGGATPGIVISCGSGYCQPVLTYAAERINLQYPNGTEYNVYTSVYYLSGGDLRGRNVTYNVYFRGPSGRSLPGYRDSPQLEAFDIVQEKVVFKSSREYTQMCIEFSERFPVDNSLNNAESYCRPILESAFDTGSPWTPEEEGSTGEYLEEYDEDGNRIRASGKNTVDTRPPGVFDE